jgi:hypothetical protein
VQKPEVIRDDAEGIWIETVAQVGSQRKLNIVIQKTVDRCFRQTNAREQPREISSCMDVPAELAKRTDQQFEKLCP